MGQLKLNVKNQIISRTDNFRVVADSRNYLYADFTFTEEWENEQITAIFTRGNEAYNAIVDNGTCLVPWEVIKAPSFYISVFCDNLVTANIVKIDVEKSGFTDDGQIPGTPTPTVWEQYMTELEEKFAEAAEEYMPAKATDTQAAEGTDDNTYMTPLKSKTQFNHLIGESLTNVPEIYAKETIEGMQAITGMKHGDMCIILSGNTSAQSIYRYYTKDINGSPLSNPQWVWLTDLSLFAPKPVLQLTEVVDEVGVGLTHWDYTKGNIARIDSLGGGWNGNLFYIDNIKSGDVGVIDVYSSNNYDLFDIVNATSQYPDFGNVKSPDWEYLTPATGQHYRYSFLYDGAKLNWSRSVWDNE